MGTAGAAFADPARRSRTATDRDAPKARRPAREHRSKQSFGTKAEVDGRLLMNDESALTKLHRPGGGLTVEIAEKNMRRLHAEVCDALAAAEIPIETINELAGPNPGPLPAQLKTMLNMGAGYFRTVRATIEKLFRQRN